ncbi:MAG: endonuclease/exonuclease/phosphatase family protein [bacterium]|nr:endonuclease/exonuclease/phosphatase family protein [bacterium]
MKKITLFVVAVLLLGTTICFSAKKPVPLRIMTYNIRYDNPDDSLNNWIYRKDFIVSLINYHRPDLLCIQEGLLHQNLDLAALLPEYGWLGMGRDDGKTAGEYAAIFYRKDRFIPQQDSSFWLSETPDQQSMGWDAVCIRIATWCRFKDKLAKKSFYVFNTHFDHMGGRARDESALLLKSQIVRIAGKSQVLLAGDFNSPESDKPYLIITGKQEGDALTLSDAMYLSQFKHHGPLRTYSGFSVKEGIIGNRIDYIFVSSGVQVIRHAILSDFKDDYRFPSDHLPVIAEVVVE